MGGGRGMRVEKAKDFKGTAKKLFAYMKKDMLVIIIAFILAVGGVVATITVPDILGGATDTLMTGALQKTIYNSIVPMTQFDEQTLDMFDKMGALTIGDLKNCVSIPEEGFDPDNAGSLETAIVLGLTQEQKKQILDLPKEMNTVRPSDIATACRKATTVGEFSDIARMGAMLDKVPDAYMQSVRDMSLTVPPQMDMEKIIDIMIKLVILVVVSGIMSYAQGFLLSGVSQKISYRFRKDLNEKIDKLPLAFYDKTTNGEVMSLITNDIDTISTSLNQSLSQMLTSITTVIGVLIMMLKISPLLTLISLVSVPLLLIAAMLIIKRSQKYFKRQQEYLGHVNGQIEEMFAGHNVVKLFNGEEKSVNEFNKYNNELCSSALSSQFFSGLMQPTAKAIGNLGFTCVCILGGFLVVSGSGLGVGNIQSFIQYVRQFNQPITQLASVANTFQSTIAAAERVFGFLEQEEEKETGDFSVEKVKGDVDFVNVKFGYSADKIVIKDFSSSVKSGQRVAIVGPTGSGKTTLVKLLMRYYDLNNGKILLDGRDIKEFSRNSLRSHIGMVLQDTWLYNGTIMENIRYGRLDASDEEVIKAAKLACADHFIKTLDGGYDFVINADAGNISQGQKQLLTIARAILADSEIMILDEATSLVDTRTEMLIQQAMRALMEGRTSFVIAHRLSTIKDADNILVLKDGDIIEQGTHEELLQKQGFYAELYNAQFLGMSIDDIAAKS
jgi:ATP-binding cassette subfamily B protein